jgi:type 2 lantibiotic biosynthesis protein LanM
MNQQIFADSAWYHALTLTERINSLCCFHNNFPQVEVNAKQAQKRIQKWRTQAPFKQEIYFEQRLATSGITEEEFLFLLGEPMEVLKHRLSHEPSWLQVLKQAFSNPLYSKTNQTLSANILCEQKEANFWYAIEPLINQGIDRLHQGIHNLILTKSDLPFDPDTVEAVFLANLPGQVFWMLNRTMALELNIARIQGQLSGQTPEERFESFLMRLRNHDVALSILQEYPVLAQQLVIGIERWVRFSLEFLQHLCADWDAIRTTFSPDQDPGLLVKLDGGAGDVHRGGRSVMIAKFDSGFHVVYKPKSLNVDLHFQELLVWLNQRGNHPPFRTLKILAGDNYGWVEFIAAETCNSPAEVERFYERQGGYLALLYALEATDFFYENLIAAGEHPVLIDLESLFHPHLGEANPQESLFLARQKASDSVLRVGLLPQRLWSNAESEGIDISGLGAAGGQLTPNPVPSWTKVGTDEMRLTRQRIKMPGGKNQPSLNGVQVDILNYAEMISSGFTKIYQLLLQYRDELLLPNGPLAKFANDEVRVILRPTRTYARLLRESFHPDFLRSALEREHFFDYLWVEVQQRPCLSRVIAVEQEDLWQGDIPMFTTYPSSRNLWSSTNKEIADFFEQSGLTLVQSRLQKMGQDDLERQLWFIKASLTTLSMDEDRVSAVSYQLIESPTAVDRETILAAAQKIGDRLELLALRSEQDVSWLGLMLLKGNHWSLMPLGIDLYDGIPGIILFLAYLGEITQTERYTQLAKFALGSLLRQVKLDQSLTIRLGCFDGWGGIIYLLTHLSHLWQQPELLAEAENFVELSSALIEQDQQFDIIGGVSGYLCCLLGLYRSNPTENILAAAIKCGDHLIAHAQPMAEGIGWIAGSIGKRPLAGFSHGVAGIAWALLDLAAITKQERFHRAALEAIAYERSLFSKETANWPDLRRFEESILTGSKQVASFMTAWCHGAPGVGLGRLRSLPYLQDAQIMAEIETAVKTTLNKGFGSNHSLCHGDLGNLELLLQASIILKNSDWQAQVNRLAAIILNSISEHGWLCGVPLGVETPGLMTGLAGIGYGLLRLAEPLRVPSILLLEPAPLRLDNFN